MKNARYPIASITSKDINLLERRNNVKVKYNVTDEDIFNIGIEALEKELIDKPNR